MADNFDLKKFLKKNKALENLNPSLKSINENSSREDMKAKIKEMIVAELEGEIDNDPDAKLNADYDPIYEGDDTSEEDKEEEEAYIEGGFGSFEEAKKKDKEDVEDVEVTDTEIEDIPAEDEMPAEDAPEATGGIEDIAADMKGTEADLMDHLMKAFQIAKGMQNEKLETQVGNTLKFFVSEYIGGGE
jgi:hypothetical protein